MLVGYARTSTTDQVAGLDAQIDLLRATGCTKIFSEQVSSVTVAKREQLAAVLDFCREGDTLVACKIDRLARSTLHLLEIVDLLERKCVALRVLDFAGSELDTKSPSGRMLLTMFGAFAEFERATLLERQVIGIARAKAAGRYKGRAPTARRLSGQVKELRASGMGTAAIAKQLGISRSSAYRILADVPAA